MASHRGDDLDDDFLLDEIVAYSDPEDGNSGLGDDEDIGRLLSGDEDQEATDRAKQEKDVEKKRKRKEKLKEKKVKRRKIEDETPTTPIAAQSPSAIAEYLAAMQAKAFPKSTALELEDRAIPASSIADTTTWRESRSLEHLEEFIIQAVPSLHKRLSQRTKSPGAPTMLFVVSAAMRGADATRALKSEKLRGERGATDVAKLFAKHFKLEQQVSYLKKTKVGSAVGTPARLGKLLNDTDALSVDALTHIVLDISFKDAKNYNVLEIAQTRDEVFKTVLGAPGVMEGIKKGKIQLVLF